MKQPGRSSAEVGGGGSCSVIDAVRSRSASCLPRGRNEVDMDMGANWEVRTTWSPAEGAVGGYQGDPYPEVPGHAMYPQPYLLLVAGLVRQACRITVPVISGLGMDSR